MIFLGAGVAVSAPVRSDSPRFASDVIFPSWSGIDVEAALGPQLGVPVYLYEAAALRPECRNLADIRRGNIPDPDFGSFARHPSAGAVVES